MRQYRFRAFIYVLPLLLSISCASFREKNFFLRVNNDGSGTFLMIMSSINPDDVVPADKLGMQGVQNFSCFPIHTDVVTTSVPDIDNFQIYDIKVSKKITKDRIRIILTIPVGEEAKWMQKFIPTSQLISKEILDKWQKSLIKLSDGERQEFLFNDPQTWMFEIKMPSSILVSRVNREAESDVVLGSNGYNSPTVLLFIFAKAKQLKKKDSQIIWIIESEK